MLRYFLVIFLFPSSLSKKIEFILVKNQTTTWAHVARAMHDGLNTFPHHSHGTFTTRKSPSRTDRDQQKQPHAEPTD